MSATPSDNISSRRVLQDFSFDNIKNQTTMRVPLVIVSTYPVKERGNIVYDTAAGILFFSTGLAWEPITSGSLSCIQDADGDTRVCVDTVPPTDADIITFETVGTERGRFNTAGVFMVGTTTPAAGKVAHFEGDIKVTGVIDPTATQFEEGATVPVDPTGTTTGVLWIRDDNPNVLVFTDNTGTDTVLGSGGGGTTPVAPVYTLTGINGWGQAGTARFARSGNTVILSLGGLTGVAMGANTNTSFPGYQLNLGGDTIFTTWGGTYQGIVNLNTISPGNYAGNNTRLAIVRINTGVNPPELTFVNTTGKIDNTVAATNNTLITIPTSMAFGMFITFFVN